MIPPKIESYCKTCGKKTKHLVIGVENDIDKGFLVIVTKCEICGHKTIEIEKLSSVMEI